MIGNILSFPDQLAFEVEPKGEPKTGEFRGLVVCGMGGSGVVGDLLLDWLDAGVRVVKGYSLPPVGGDELVLLVSYSGNTEETLSCYDQALKRGLEVVCISSGGELAKRALSHGIPHYGIPGGYQPREAFGYLLAASVKALRDHGFLNEDLYSDFLSSSKELLAYKDELRSQDGPAYEIATKLYKRLPIIYSQFSAPLLRWKAQLNENSKSFAHIATLPEQNHNDVQGFKHPDFLLNRMFMLFLRTSYDHPRVKLRVEILKDVLEDEVVGYQDVEAKGSSKLAQLLYLMWFGDVVSYWLAVEYSEDPYDIDKIVYIKSRLT